MQTYLYNITHSFITNAKLYHKLSVVGWVYLISIHVQLYLQVYTACLQPAIHMMLQYTRLYEYL